jgi:hypothetical protein
MVPGGAIVLDAIALDKWSLIDYGSLDGAVGEGVVFNGDFNGSRFHPLHVFPTDNAFGFIAFAG